MVCSHTVKGERQRFLRAKLRAIHFNGAGLGGSVVDQCLVIVYAVPRPALQQRISKRLSINKGGVAGHAAPLPLA